MVAWEHDAGLLPIVRTHMGLQKLEDSGALVCSCTVCTVTVFLQANLHFLHVAASTIDRHQLKCALCV